MRPPPEKTDLDLVAQLFTAGGYVAERFSKAEQRASKTPDFRITSGGAVAAYCEVKSPNDTSLDDALDKAAPFTIVGGARPDPIFNRLSGHIEKAVKQFDALNPDRVVPNILVFVNYDSASKRDDLVEVLTGNLELADGTLVSTMKHISEGRIRELKSRIDLYAWLDGLTGKVTQWIFSDADEAHRKSLCVMLGLDESQIKR